MKWFLEFMFTDLGHFIGAFLLFDVFILAPLLFLYKVSDNKIRANTIREKGYPPLHCDAYGDLASDEEIIEEEEEYEE